VPLARERRRSRSRMILSARVAILSRSTKAHPLEALIESQRHACCDLFLVFDRFRCRSMPISAFKVVVLFTGPIFLRATRNPYARSETGKNALPVKESYTSGIDRVAPRPRRGAAREVAAGDMRAFRCASARVRHARVCAPAAPHTWTAAYVPEYRNGDSARRETSLPALAGLCSPDRAAIKTFAQIA